MPPIPPTCRAMGDRRQFNLLNALLVSAALVAALFLVAGLEHYFPLQRFGILPRTGTGLLGILFAPLLHASLHHLLANAVPLFVLLVLVLSNRAYHPYRTLGWIWFASGLGTWLIGRGNAVHIGASSIVFGLAAFLIVAGFLMKSWWSAAVAVFVGVCYGGIFYGALPQAGPISWEGHLSGVVAGAWTASGLKR
jgi:membrane associated rhomboid family serine protease